jgi:hypothetical protein
MRAGTHGRSRQDLERALDEDAERAEGADEELVEVIARDVLHDAAAGPRDGAVAEDGRCTDEQVADPAVPGAPESGAVRRYDPADRRRIGVRWVDGQELSGAREGGAQLGEGRARRDRDREVGGNVGDDPGERGSISPR